MRKIIFVTRNKGKFEDAAKILAEYKIKVIQKIMPIPESQSWSVKEIAIEKANFVKRHLKAPFIVEDSGFYIPSLGGFPASQVNFVLETIGIEGLLTLLKRKDRYCEFRYALVYFEPRLEKPIIFEHKDKGYISNKILDKEIEHSWSPLVKIFIPQGFNRPLADAKVNKKFHENWSKISHIRKFGQWLSKKRDSSG